MKVRLRVSRRGKIGSPERLMKVLAGAMTAHAFDVMNEGNRSILKGPKTGRFYKRGRVSHRASAPGEAPATDLGHLVSSGRVNSASVEGYVVKATVGWTAIYAGWLEKGWVMKNGTHVAARPYARPAVIKKLESGTLRVRAAIREALK